MTMPSMQAPSAVVMIRPHHFRVNSETARDNAFQKNSSSLNESELSLAAHAELTLAAKTIEDAGVKVHIFEDDGVDTPDSVFPNNWFSTHAGGHIAIYPMLSKARRKERRADVIDMLKQQYRVQDIIDYSGLEHDDLILEGTGAMVLDHIDRVAYATKSKRTNPIALERFCTHFNYEPMLFEAEDENGVSIYHTNVLMCIATSFVLICLDMLKDPKRRREIVRRFEDSGRTVIDLTQSQIANFAGNALELRSASSNGNHHILALSTRALSSLTSEQKRRIEASVSILSLNIPTIELAGGSVRCTLAGIHLLPR